MKVAIMTDDDELIYSGTLQVNDAHQWNAPAGNIIEGEGRTDYILDSITITVSGTEVLKPCKHPAEHLIHSMNCELCGEHLGKQRFYEQLLYKTKEDEHDL